MWKKLWLLAIVLLLLPDVHSSAASTAPYIYYYSEAQSAFIVERADGTDSRVLAPYTLPNKDTVPYKYIEIVGPGWSQSGKWFTWTSTTNYGVRSLQNVFIVNRDGSLLRTVFSAGMTTIEDMLWSPSSDFLMISYFDTTPSQALHVMIYDPDSAKIIWQATIVKLLRLPVGDDESIYQLSWSPDGKLISIGIENEIVVVNYAADSIKVLGARSNQVIDCKFQIFSDTTFSSFHWLSAGRIMYVDLAHGDWTIQQLDTRELTTINLLSGNESVIDWSPDQKDALTATHDEDSDSELWAISIADHSAVQLFAGIDMPFYCDSPFYGVSWNKNDQVAFEVNAQLFVWTPSSRQLIQVTPPTKGIMEDLNPIRWLADGQLMFLWTTFEPGSTVYTGGTQIYVFNPQTGNMRQIAPTGSQSTGAIGYFEPLVGPFVAYSDDRFTYILDTQSHVETQLEFKGDPDYGVQYIIGHPTQQWLFLLGNEIEGQNPINVANFDGTIQRELALCDPHGASCFGWLPDLTAY